MFWRNFYFPTSNILALFHMFYILIFGETLRCCKAESIKSLAYTEFRIFRSWSMIRQPWVLIRVLWWDISVLWLWSSFFHLALTTFVCCLLEEKFSCRNQVSWKKWTGWSQRFFLYLFYFFLRSVYFFYEPRSFFALNLFFLPFGRRAAVLCKHHLSLRSLFFWEQDWISLGFTMGYF